MKTVDVDHSPLLDDSTITEILNLQADSILKQNLYYRSPLATIEEYGSHTSSASDNYKDDITLLKEVLAAKFTMITTSSDNTTCEDDSSTSHRTTWPNEKNSQNIKENEQFDSFAFEGKCMEDMLTVTTSEKSIVLDIVDSNPAEKILNSQSLQKLLAEGEVIETESFQNLLRDLGEFNTYANPNTEPSDNLLKYTCLKRQNEKQNKEISSGDKEMLYRASEGFEEPKQTEVIGSGDISTNTLPNAKAPFPGGSATKRKADTKSNDEPKSERKHCRSKSRDDHKTKLYSKSKENIPRKKEKTCSESESTNVSSTLSMSSANSLILRNKFHFTQEYTPYNYKSLAKQLLSNDSEVPIYNSKKNRKHEDVSIIPVTAPTSSVLSAAVEMGTPKTEYSIQDINLSRPETAKPITDEPQINDSKPNKRQFLEDLTRSIVDSETYFQRCLTELNKCAAKVVKHKEDTAIDADEKELPSKEPSKRPMSPSTARKTFAPGPKEKSASIEISEKVKEIEQTMKDIDENKIQSQIKVVNKKYKEELTTLIEKLKFLASYRKRVAVRPSRKRKVTKEKLELLEKAKKKEQELLTNNDFEEIVTQMECDSSGKPTTPLYQSSEIQKSVQKVVEWRKSSGVGKASDMPVDNVKPLRKSDLTHSESSVGSKAKTVKSFKNRTFASPSVKNSSSKVSVSRKSKLGRKSTNGSVSTTQALRGVHKNRTLNSVTNNYECKISSFPQKKNKIDLNQDLNRKNVIDVKRDTRYKKALEKVIKYSEKPVTIPPINVIDQNTLNLLRDECMRLQKHHKPLSRDYPKLQVGSAAVAQSMDEESRLLSAVTPEAVAPFAAEYSKQKYKLAPNPSDTNSTETKEHPLSRVNPTDTVSRTINLSQMQYLQNLITDPNARFNNTMTIMPVTVKNTFKARSTKKDVKESKEAKVEAEKPFDHQTPRRVDFSGIKSNVKSPVKAYISGVQTNSYLNAKSLPKGQLYKDILKVPDEKPLKMGVIPNKSKSGPHCESFRPGLPMHYPQLSQMQPPPQLLTTQHAPPITNSMPSPVMTAHISHHYETPSPIISQKPETVNSLIDDILSLTRPTKTAQIKYNQIGSKPQIRPVPKHVGKSIQEVTVLPSVVKSIKSKTNIEIKNIDAKMGTDVSIIKEENFKESNSMENVEFLKYVEASVLSKRTSLKSKSRENLGQSREKNKGVMDLHGTTPITLVKGVRKELVVSKSSENLDKEKIKLRPLSSSGSEGSICEKGGKKKPRCVGRNRTTLEVKENDLGDVGVNLAERALTASILSVESSVPGTKSRLSNLAQPRSHYVRAHCEEFKQRLGKTFTDRMSRFIEKSELNTPVTKNHDNTLFPTSNSILFENVMHALENVIDSSGINKTKLKVFLDKNANDTLKFGSSESPSLSPHVTPPKNRPTSQPKNRPMSQPKSATPTGLDVKFYDDHSKTMTPSRRSRLMEAAKSPKHPNSESLIKTMHVMNNLRNQRPLSPNEPLTSVEEVNSFINDQLDLLLQNEIVASKTYTALDSDEPICSFRASSEKTVMAILDSILEHTFQTAGDHSQNLQVNPSESLFTKCSSSTLFLKLEEILSQESNLTTSNSSTTILSYIPIENSIKSNHSIVTVLHPLRRLLPHGVQCASHIQDAFYRAAEFYLVTNYYKIQIYASHFRYLMDTFYPIYTMCVDNSKNKDMSSRTSFLPTIESDLDYSSDETQSTLSEDPLRVIGFDKSRTSVKELPVRAIIPNKNLSDISTKEKKSSCKDIEPELKQESNVEEKKLVFYKHPNCRPIVLNAMNLSMVVIEWEFVDLSDNNLAAPMDVIFTGSGDGGTGNMDQMQWAQLYHPKNVSGKTSSLSVCVSQTTEHMERNFIATTLSNSSINTFFSLSSSKSVASINDDNMVGSAKDVEFQCQKVGKLNRGHFFNMFGGDLGKFLVNSRMDTIVYKRDLVEYEPIACRDVTLFVCYGLLFVCVFSCFTVQPTCS